VTENGAVTSGAADEGFGPYITLLKRRRRVVIGVPLVAALVVAASLYFSKREYRAEASFIAQQPSSGSISSKLGSLAGLASSVTGGGMSLGSSFSASSPDFYAEVLASNELLRDVSVTQYHSTRPGGFNGDIVKYLDVHKETPELSTQWTLKPLKNRLTAVSVDIKSDIITVSSTTTDPDLSLGIVRRMLELVNAFDLRRMQQQATAEQDFSDRRSKDAWGELNKAEQALIAFDEQNRSVLASPRLQTERQGLQRHIEMAEELYLQLVEQFQQASLDALRNTPMIAVINHPEGLVVPVQKQIPLKAAIAVVATFIICALIIFVVDRERLHSSTSESLGGHRAPVDSRSLTGD
jgi:uncharacterized protein involved in exopolysaccharide biosynthesis